MLLPLLTLLLLTKLPLAIVDAFSLAAALLAVDAAVTNVTDAVDFVRAANFDEGGAAVELCCCSCCS